MRWSVQDLKPKILIADDDAHIREVIRFALDKAEMDVTAASDGADVMAQFAKSRPDLIVLDVGMPELDGLDVCREIRKVSDVPILFLSARDEEIDRVLGLEIGGDDYVTKPFSPRELVARVKAILRRKGALPETAEPALLQHGALSIDQTAHVARFDGNALALTALEFAIMRTFLLQKNRAFSREQIMQAAYPANIHVADRTIDSHIRNIRAAFAGHGCVNVLETVHGIGFRLGTCEPSR
jgi:two-component system, OmpR family, response regulator